MVDLNFDASQVAPSESMDIIPTGWYMARIDQSERKPTKDGVSHMLALTFTIIDGRFKNRKIFANLNLWNKSQEAVTIANRELSALCHATGVMQVRSSQELHGIPMKIHVKVQPARGEFGESNKISGYKNANDNSVAADSTASTPQMPSGFPNAGFGTPVQGMPNATGMPQQPWQNPANPQQVSQPVATMQVPFGQSVGGTAPVQTTGFAQTPIQQQPQQTTVTQTQPQAPSPWIAGSMQEMQTGANPPWGPK